MRLLLILATLTALTACGPAPQPTPQPKDRPKPDLTTEDWYRQTTEQLTAMNREAESLLKRGRLDQAAAIVTRAQPLQNRLLAVPRPTLAAMEAASDLDDLYGRMLLRNRHYDWARSVFQKNAVRWKYWKPETAETMRRLKAANSAIAECDRHLRE